MNEFHVDRMWTSTSGVRLTWTHVDRGRSKTWFFVDVINGWHLT